LDRLKITLLTAFVIAILCTPTAFAQPVAAHITVVSGSGQMIKAVCFGIGCFNSFYPMVVKVTDANGNPLYQYTVTAVTGAAFSVYSTFIARGEDVVLPANTPVKINLAARGGEAGSR